MAAEQSFEGLQSETLVKAPGSIRGEAFAIRNLTDCSVFILDYTSEVEVSGCTNCQLFIGPVDGPALFQDCTNCQVAVACQQFQAKACSGVEFGLFCATQPSISSSAGIKIACWAGAYPGLTEHFASANLDPLSNHWSKVYDASAEEGAPPNYEVVADPSPWWEVPLEGSGAPDNPVPRSDGSLYAPAPAAPAAAAAAFDNPVFEGQAAEGEAAPAPAEAAPAAPATNGISDDFLAEGGVEVAADPAAVDGPAPSTSMDGEHPALVAARAALAQRLAAQAKEEGEKKGQVQAAAAAYLQSFYEKRAKSKEERIRAGREALQGKESREHGPVGDNAWERTLSLINFNLTKPAGSDLSRFKSVLFSLKAKGSGAA